MICAYIRIFKQLFQVWAQTNKPVINMLKTKEIVYHRPNHRGLVIPPPLTNIDAMITSRIMYYSAAAWKGFATVAECNAKQAFLNKVKR